MNTALKQRINNALYSQGYTVQNNKFSIEGKALVSLRKVHALAKKERIVKQTQFIEDSRDIVLKHMCNGAGIEVKKISPILLPD